jgi:hypothetical protein
VSCSYLSDSLRSMPWSYLLTRDIFSLVQEILQEIHHTAGGRQEDLNGQENQQEPHLLYTPLTSRDGSHKDNFGESLQILLAALRSRYRSHKDNFGESLEILLAALRSRDGSHKNNFGGESLEILSAAGSSNQTWISDLRF